MIRRPSAWIEEAHCSYSSDQHLLERCKGAHIKDVLDQKALHSALSPFRRESSYAQTGQNPLPLVFSLRAISLLNLSLTSSSCMQRVLYV